MSGLGNEWLFFPRYILVYLKQLLWVLWLDSGSGSGKGRIQPESFFQTNKYFKWGMFFIQVFFWSSSASAQSVSNISRGIPQNIARLSSARLPVLPLLHSIYTSFGKGDEWPFLTFSWVFQLESLSFVVILTFHITFVNVSYKLFFFELTFPSYGS